MAHQIQFVDAVSASATVLLDLNADEFRCVRFVPNPPDLRRTVSQNAMTDGGSVGASSYDLRTIDVTIELVAADIDAWAAKFQKLARILDGKTAVIRYRRDGATYPVFFTTYRSPLSEVLEVASYRVRDQVSFTLLADPFAYGTLESFSGTISQDATSGSSFIATTPTIKGDVAAPFAVDLDGTGIYAAKPLLLASIASEATPSLTRVTANGSFTLGTDASNVTGAGGSIWNGDYVNVSFGTTTTDANRASFSASLPAGRWRVLARVANYDATPVDTDYISLHVRQTDSGGTALETGSTVKLYESSGDPLLYSMGVFTVPFGGAPNSGNTTAYFRLHAAQTSSTGALRIDGVVFVPVELADFTDQTSALLSNNSGDPTSGVIVDGLTQETYYGDYGSGDPYSPPPMLGGFGRLSPGQVNSLIVGTGVLTVSYAVYYHPLYTLVRPVGS